MRMKSSVTCITIVAFLGTVACADVHEADRVVAATLFEQDSLATGETSMELLKTKESSSKVKRKQSALNAFREITHDEVKSLPHSMGKVQETVKEAAQPQVPPSWKIGIAALVQARKLTIESEHRARLAYSKISAQGQAQELARKAIHQSRLKLKSAVGAKNTDLLQWHATKAEKLVGKSHAKRSVAEFQQDDSFESSIKASAKSAGMVFSKEARQKDSLREKHNEEAARRMVYGEAATSAARPKTVMVELVDQPKPQPEKTVTDAPETFAEWEKKMAVEKKARASFKLSARTKESSTKYQKAILAHASTLVTLASGQLKIASGPAPSGMDQDWKEYVSQKEEALNKARDQEIQSKAPEASWRQWLAKRKAAVLQQNSPTGMVAKDRMLGSLLQQKTKELKGKDTKLKPELDITAVSEPSDLSSITMSFAKKLADSKADLKAGIQKEVQRKKTKYMKAKPVKRASTKYADPREAMLPPDLRETAPQKAPQAPREEQKDPRESMLPPDMRA